MMEKGGFTEDPRELQLEMVFSLNRLPASEEKKEDFLARWSRLKNEKPELPEKKDEAPAKPLPPVDQLTPESDFSGFMNPKVEDALRRQNVEIPAGRIESTQREFTVLSQSDLRTAEQFNRMILTESRGYPVRLDEWDPNPPPPRPPPGDPAGWPRRKRRRAVLP